MQKYLKLLDQYIEEVPTAILMALMSIIIVVQVFMRYVMQSSLSWSEELARYLFIYIIYLGVSQAVKEDRHIRVEAFISIFPNKVQKVIKIISDILFLVFTIIVIVKGYEIINKMIVSGQHSPALGIPMTIVYAAPFIGYSLIFFRMTANIINKIKNFNCSDECIE
ncbi:MAG: TRAP transporter small permease [Clostridia bacterium]|nr:TRAP transporter small permease [Clostridia bacterium]